MVKSDASSDLTIQYSPNWCTTLGTQRTACSADQGNFWASVIDANLIAENIKTGISTFGVSGNAVPAYAACSEDSGTVNAAQCLLTAVKLLFFMDSMAPLIVASELAIMQLAALDDDIISRSIAFKKINIRVFIVTSPKNLNKNVFFNKTNCPL